MTLNNQKDRLETLPDKIIDDTEGMGKKTSFQLTIKLAHSLEKIGSILEH